MKEISTIAIRRAKVSDIDSVVSLAMELMKMHAKQDPLFEMKIGVRPVYKKYFIEGLRSSKKILLIARDREIVVGYILAVYSERKPIFKIKNIGVVNEIYILPEYRKQGIARKLLEEIDNWFKKKNLHHSQLFVHGSNISAQKTWKALGFKSYMSAMHRSL
ncbi:MAG: GNAT family N-acetyltransferase [bacterium]|nr:GNAT family N-acetyltransferase [bacterium]